MEYVQIQLNYLGWEDPTVETRKCYEVETRHIKPVIVMEPIKCGSLVIIPDETKSLFQSQLVGRHANDRLQFSGNL